MALGASRMGVVRGVVSKTVRFAVMGEAIGLCAVVVIYQRISGLLYAVAPYSAGWLVAVVIFVFGVAVGASFWPAWCAVDRESIDLG